MADAQSWKGAAFHYSAAVSDLCGQFFTEAAEAGTGALQPSGTGEKTHRHHAFLGKSGTVSGQRVGGDHTRFCAE